MEWLRRRWAGLRGIANGLFAVASPPNGGDAVIGRETRVLLRHYLEQGLSKAAVARQVGVSRRTVHRWIAAGQLDRELDDEPVKYGPRRRRPSQLDPYREIIRVRLEAYLDLSAVRLFDEIRAAGYEGGYDQVRRYVREVRPRQPPEPVQRFETPPGHQGQVDFAEFKTPWGKRHALVVVLGYSRLLWVRYYERQTMAVVMEGLESAFRYFGGVPSELLFDQMKAVIVEDNREVGGRLMENTEFLRFAVHWGFRIRACRPYRARTKGKVERPVSYIRRSFFYGRAFVSDDDLNARVLGWLDTVANVRVHGTLKERPVDRFEAERPHLKPLARWPYRPVAPRRPEPSAGRDDAAARSRFVEVERRPLAEYARIAGGVLLDRLLHRCHIVNIRGNSYRMRRHAELSKAIHPLANRIDAQSPRLGEGSVMTTTLAARAPAPVAPLPPRGSRQTGTFSMPITGTSSVPIDTVSRFGGIPALKAS